MLATLREKFEAGQSPGDEPAADAAVLIPITAEREPRVILTLRAAHLKAHAGEVAFPGGKRDAADRSLCDTALRESREEIGLDPAWVDVVGPGRQRTSRYGLRVSPFVGIVSPGVLLTANPDELDEVFRVPLAYFLLRENLRVESVVHEGREMDLPWYPWQGKQVWGLTAIMLIDLLNKAFDFGVQLRR